MESVVLVLLLILFGGGGLLIALIFAIITGSARSARLQRLEAQQQSLQAALDTATGRVQALERALGDASSRIAWLHQELTERRPELPRPAAPPAESEAPVAVEAPQVPAVREAEVAAPEPPAPVSIPVAVDESPAAAPEPAAPAAEAAAPEAAAPAPEPAAPAPEPAAPPPEAAAPAPPPPPSPAPESLVPPPPAFDWERWVGVRGAAALGACVLVIAGLYFFKYSIDNGLISPTLRVVLGVLVGLGCIGASEVNLRKSHTVLANWLAGAGVAILYTAFWSAHALYGLVGAPLSFGLMILVTAACGLLALRHEAVVIALLGLVGGFATPVALSSGDDHPFGLFGYLLLLDAALLYLAHRRRWPVLAALSLGGTALYQVGWIGERMGPERVGLGMGICVLFGGVYALAAPRAEKSESELWKITRAAAVLLPFGFGLYFGLRGGPGERVYPIGLMLCVLSAGASWIARARAVGWAAPAAAAFGTTTLGAWLLVHDGRAAAWEATLCVALLAAVFHAFVELDARRPREGARAPIAGAAAVAGVGGLFCMVGAAVAYAGAAPWPWIAGWALLGALLVRQSLVSGYGTLRLALVALVGLGFPLVHAMHADTPGFPGERIYLVAIAALAALGLLSSALLSRRPDAPPSSKAAAHGPPVVADALASLVPFFAALYFARRPEIAAHPTPLALALAALAAGTAWAARARREAEWITGGAALLGLAALATWMAYHAPEQVAWEASLAVCVFAAAFHALAEIALRREAPPAPLADPASALTAVGGIAVLAMTAAGGAGITPWPWLAGWLVLAAMALRQLGLPGREPLHPVLGVVLGLAFPLVQTAHFSDSLFPSASTWMAIALATAVGVSAASFLHRESRASRWAGHGSAVLALLLLLCALAPSRTPVSPWIAHADILALTALALISAARLGAGGWSLAAAIASALACTALLGNLRSPADTPEQLSAAHAAIVGQGLAVLLVAAWPLLARGRLRRSAWAWRASALAGPLSFVGLRHAWVSAFGEHAIGVLPVVLGAVTLAVAWRATTLEDGLPTNAGARRTALVWLCGVTLAAVSLAIPLQLQNESVTVGWAIEGAALLVLWRRLDHAGLKYTALVHLSAVALRLVANPWVLEYHARSGVPVLNWLAYAYWIPALALVAAWWALRDLEVPRRRSWEGAFYGKGSAFFAACAAAAAVAVFFVWINLTIFDAFGTGRALEIDLERLPARDLTLSIAWAVYALALLSLGIARRSAALRWTSLMLVLVTVGKVFLWDLGHLHDLYRVVSLVGLALSLILVALAYQRFVFGKQVEGKS